MALSLISEVETVTDAPVRATHWDAATALTSGQNWPCHHPEQAHNYQVIDRFLFLLCNSSWDSSLHKLFKASDTVRLVTLHTMWFSCVAQLKVAAVDATGRWHQHRMHMQMLTVQIRHTRQINKIFLFQNFLCPRLQKLTWNNRCLGPLWLHMWNHLCAKIQRI